MGSIDQGPWDYEPGVPATVAQIFNPDGTTKRGYPHVTNPRRQVGGNHYLRHGNMQPFDIIDEYELNFYEGTALKYLLRWREKGGVEDLEKAKHFIEILIQKERSPDGGNLPETPSS